MEAPIPVVALFTPLRIGQTLLNPQLREALVQELRTRAQREGRWEKGQVLYFPITPIPAAAWFYECSTCTFFSFGDRSCELVKGRIEPYAWCGLWVNREEDLPFSWLRA